LQRRVDREDRKWEELSIEKWSGVERSGVERVEWVDMRGLMKEKWIGEERRGEELSETDKRDEKRRGVEQKEEEWSRAEHSRSEQVEDRRG
jgi:hypothetical protein